MIVVVFLVVAVFINGIVFVVVAVAVVDHCFCRWCLNSRRRRRRRRRRHRRRRHRRRRSHLEGFDSSEVTTQNRFIIEADKQISDNEW